jgi:hypothetical protein
VAKETKSVRKWSIVKRLGVEKENKGSREKHRVHQSHQIGWEMACDKKYCSSGTQDHINKLSLPSCYHLEKSLKTIGLI